MYKIPENQNKFEYSDIFPLEYWCMLIENDIKTAVRLSNIKSSDIGHLMRFFTDKGFAATPGDSSYQIGKNGLYEYNAKNGKKHYLFVAKNQDIIEKIVELDNIEKHSPDKSARVKASKKLGFMLGYPECCIDFYLSFLENSHQTAHILRPYFNTIGNVNRMLNPFFRMLGHAPCSYSCQKSIETNFRVQLEAFKLLTIFASQLFTLLKSPVLFFEYDFWIQFTRKSNDKEFYYDSFIIHNAEHYPHTIIEELESYLMIANRLAIRNHILEIYEFDKLIYEFDTRPICLKPVLFDWDNKLPRKRLLRVAVLDFQRSKDDFAGSITLMTAAGDMDHIGIKNEIIRIVTGFSGDQFTLDQCHKLLTYLKESNSNVVCFATPPEEGILELLRKEHKATIYLKNAEKSTDDSTYDFSINAQNRTGLVNLIDRLMNYEFNGMRRIHKAIQLDINSEDLNVDLQYFYNSKQFWPATTYRDLTTMTVKKYNRFTLLSNLGCPYSAEILKNDFFHGIDAELNRFKGCSFCEKGGDYRQIPVNDYVGFLATQIEYYRRRVNDAEMILIDENALFYLNSLIDELIKRKCKNVSLFIKTRIRTFLQQAGLFRKTLNKAEQNEIKIFCYLMGIENFDDIELKRYNKGITRHNILECLDKMRDYESEFPNSFSLDKYPSHGFILFNPWTSMSNLAVNIEYFNKYDILQLSKKAPTSRLRMYTFQPLYWKAKKDGLLAKKEDFQRIFTPQVAYGENEIPWKFKHKKVETVYYLTSQGTRKYSLGVHRSVEILEKAMQFVNAGHADDLDLEEALTQFQKEEHSFFAELDAQETESAPVNLPLDFTTKAQLTTVLSEFQAAIQESPWKLQDWNDAPFGFRLKFTDGENELFVRLEPYNAKTPAFQRTERFNVVYETPQFELSTYVIQLLKKLIRYLDGLS